MLSEKTRAYLYRVFTAVVPILVTYGVLSDGDASLYLGLAGAVLALGEGALASANTKRK